MITKLRTDIIVKDMCEGFVCDESEGKGYLRIIKDDYDY